MKTSQASDNDQKGLPCLQWLISTTISLGLTKELQWIKENHKSLLGVGMGDVWICGLLKWIDWWNAREFVQNAIAFGVTALVSMVMSEAYMHMNKQERRIKELEEKIYYLKESKR